MSMQELTINLPNNPHLREMSHRHHNGQEVFVWSDCLLDLGTDSHFGNVVFV